MEAEGGGTITPSHTGGCVRPAAGLLSVLVDPGPQLDAVWLRGGQRFCVPDHAARCSISLISSLRLNLARESFVLDSDAAIFSGHSGPETCGMRRVQTQSCVDCRQRES